MTVDRRTFLLSSAVAAGAIAGLRPKVYAAGSDTVADSALSELRASLSGRLVTGTDSDYDTVRKVRNRSYDGVRPRGIVMAQTAEDVRRAVSWASTHKTAIVPRSGGHSYIGQSTTDGLVVSVVPMSKIKVDKAAMTATIGAGAMLIDVNVGLIQQGVGLPTGSCPSVGVAGLTLGGGVGFSSRKWGLMCDNLVGVEMVTAAGEVVRADEKTNPELLWACRGGGGGHFGIVTSFTFKVHALEPISGYAIRWDWKHADKVLDVWQRWAAEGPDELFSVCAMTRGKTEPSIRSHGRFFGSKQELRKLLAPLRGVAKPAKFSVYETDLWKAHVESPKCWPDPNVCHSWNHPQPGRYKQASYTVKSDYFKRYLDEEGRAAMIRGVEGGQKQKLRWGGVILDGFGGAINKPAADDTAFVHRDSLIQVEYVAHWWPKVGEAGAERIRDWMRAFYASMRPHASGECYQNYPDLDLPNWQTAYFGQNLPRLKRCKAKIDPSGLFRGRQILTGAAG